MILILQQNHAFTSYFSCEQVMSFLIIRGIFLLLIDSLVNNAKQPFYRLIQQLFRKRSILNGGDNFLLARAVA
ncbi:hypothetical protein D3C77_606730 [compost metagenome]